MTLGDRVVVMDQGIIQQCDTPLNVYHRPANRFVAGFLGMPPMNFLQGSLSQEHNTIYFTRPGMRLRLSQEQAELLAGHIGRDVVLGIRPEAMYLQPQEHARDKDQSLTIRLNVVEPLGSAMDVYGTLPDDYRVVARVAAEPLEAKGQQVTLYIDIRKTHVFEPGPHGPNLTLVASEEAVSA